MTRRYLRWDYQGPGTYLITLTLRDRASRALGRVVDAPPRMIPSPLGEAIHAHVMRIPEFSPGLEVLGHQVMPDHLHVVLRVNRRLARPLGAHLRGFKAGCSKLAQTSTGLFADGFVDTLLFDEAAIRSALAYLADNPRRLVEKRAHPELFSVLQDLALPLALHDRPGTAHFSAIGNRHLLAQPTLLQVQCSRSEFAYAFDANRRPLKDAPPALCTPAFTEKAEVLLAAAKHGAVLLSPCISHGEQEIAHRAYRLGLKTISLQNKGFNPLYKPGGKLFDACAAGNLLLLAPAAWEYLPGEKPITRTDACVLNRIAQLLALPGAAELHYRGLLPTDIEELAATATHWAPS